VNLMTLPTDRPADEYGLLSQRSIALRKAKVAGVDLWWIAIIGNLTQNQAGYLLAIRDRIIREETTDA